MGVINPSSRGDATLKRQIAALEKRVEQLGRLITKAGGGKAATASVVYVQDDAPGNPVKGTLWLDTDAGV